MSYFKPKLWLGMTATPEKQDDDVEGRNIYEIFHYQIAYEIRLQQAMEENMLCPFHYFGISDISIADDKQIGSKKMDPHAFQLLTCNERVKHIIEQANYYGFSGDRVKGLVFCSRIDESIELSEKFNSAGFRTIALNGTASGEERIKAFERLAMSQDDATDEIQPLDYIFSVEILNEGVDIVEVNQVIMLRPTESPIVFIQQLGRGLRKANGKEYVVILDFIGNYNHNFMIPIALSGDRTYNPDTIRKYVISGNNTIPGASTVHFDQIAKEKIFASIQTFLETVDQEAHAGKITEQERMTLEYLSRTVLGGARSYELEILKRLMSQEVVSVEQMKQEFKEKYGYIIDLPSFENAIHVLQGNFVSKAEEYHKYSHIDLVHYDAKCTLQRMQSFEERLKHKEFYRQLSDIVEVGLRRYKDIYFSGKSEGSPFVLYEKYSRRDVSLLMNCGKDISSIMFGMKRLEDDVFLFVTYHKEGSTEENKNYVDGKPDYADTFEDNMLFRWDSQMGRGIDSTYVKDVMEAKNKHLFVKKSDAETNFYYMGKFDVIQVTPARKNDNNGKERDIAKFEMKMHHAVRADLLRYLQDVERA